MKSIKENTVYNAIKTFATIVFPLITIPYVNRILLSENIGKVDFGLSIVSYFSLIATLGITTYAIRECSASRNDKQLLEKKASQIFSINVLTTFIAYLLLALTLVFYKKLYNYRKLIIIQSLSLIFTTLGADWINTAMEDFRYIAIRTVTFQVVSLVLLFIFIHEPEDYIKYAIICLVSSSGANIVNIWYRRRYCKIKFTFEIDFRVHFAPIVFLFVMILAQNIFSNVDSTMLGLMKGDRAVGIYTTAQKVNNAVSQVVGSVLWVIMPRMSLYFAENDFDKINELLRKLLGFNLFVGLPCVTGLIVLSKDIILVIAGTDFIDSSPVLKIRALSLLFALFGGNLLGNAILLPSKQEKYYMKVCLITAVVNIVMNYFLIPQYGPVGAAITTAFCSLCILVLLAIKVDKRIHFNRIAKLLISPVIGCILIFLVCYFLSGIEKLATRVILSIGLSVFVYGITQLLLKNELAMEALNILVKKRR